MNRLRNIMFALAVGCAGLVAGCTVRGTTTVAVAEPTLVEIGPGVWALAHYDAPVFYSDGFYWRWYGGVWYRSSFYDGGWVRVQPSYVPVRIRRIDRPHRYVRYEPPPRARVRRAPDTRVERVPAEPGVRRRDYRE
jgi:hypothetical protein